MYRYITLDISKKPNIGNVVRIGIGDRQQPLLNVKFTDDGEKADVGGFDATLFMKSGDTVKKITAGSKVYDSGYTSSVTFTLMEMSGSRNWKRPCVGTAYVLLEKDGVKVSTQRFKFEILDGRNE